MSTLCDCCKKKMNVIVSLDDIYDFIKPRYERTGDPKDKIQAKDMYNEFVKTEAWSLFTKKEKRIWNKRNFINALSNNMEMGLDFKQRIKQNGATMRSVFINWRKK